MINYGGMTNLDLLKHFLDETGVKYRLMTHEGGYTDIYIIQDPSGKVNSK